MKEMYNNYEEEDDDWDLPEVSRLHKTHIKCISEFIIEKSERNTIS